MIARFSVSLALAVLLTIASAATINDRRIIFGNGAASLNERLADIRPTNGVTQWALLVAGSNGYFNYRHQADISHAYQVLTSHGIPAENIVTMMYDDIASNSQNPTKGKIINHPDGPNVYEGVVIDYKKRDVTPENFLKILSGDSAAMAGIGSGKVIKSGPNDNVFVNFDDHGAPGLLAFPSGELYAPDLMNTLTDMYNNKQFGKLVLYIEACESGSMFEDILPSNMNIFATTASNAVESSYACYWSDVYNAYLGDVYSVVWMENSDASDLTKETLQQQFVATRKNTTESHVMEYGDLTMGSMLVAEFQGFGKPSKSVPYPKISPFDDAVPSGDVPLHTLYNRLAKSNSDDLSTMLQRQIRDMLEKREFLRNTIKEIVMKSTGQDVDRTEMMMNERTKLTNFACYEKLVRLFSEKCFHLPENEYAYRQLYIMVNLCQSGINPSTISDAVDSTCLKKYSGTF